MYFVLLLCQFVLQLQTLLHKVNIGISISSGSSRLSHFLSGGDRILDLFVLFLVSQSTKFVPICRKSACENTQNKKKCHASAFKSVSGISSD